MGPLTHRQQAYIFSCNLSPEINQNKPLQIWTKCFHKCVTTVDLFIFFLFFSFFLFLFGVVFHHSAHWLTPHLVGALCFALFERTYLVNKPNQTKPGYYFFFFLKVDQQNNIDLDQKMSNPYREVFSVDGEEVSLECVVFLVNPEIMKKKVI